MSWSDRVNKTANAALLEFEILKKDYSVLEEGRREFGKWLTIAQDQGAKIEEFIYFVWYLIDEKNYNLLMNKG